MLGRFSGNKFGLLLRGCALDQVGVAAERLLACVRDQVVRTSAGPIAATVTIGGVVAPRHARDAHQALARAQEVLDTAEKKRLGSFLMYRPSVEREAIRRENVRATDEIVTALNERGIVLAFEPIVAPIEFEVDVDASGKITGRDPGKKIEIVRNPNWDKDTDFRPAFLDSITIEEGNDDLTVASRRTLSGQKLMCCDSGQPRSARSGTGCPAGHGSSSAGVHNGTHATRVRASV